MKRTCGNCANARWLSCFFGGCCDKAPTGHVFPDDGENCAHWRAIQAKKISENKRVHGVRTRAKLAATKGRTK